MQLGSIQIPEGAALAPMAGVTDFAFREICAGLGAALTVTEMVSAKALCYQDQKTVRLLRRNEGAVCGVQIFGSEPEIMARGAALACEYSRCDFIDINMGCPMPKIVNNGEGSALMKNPDLIEKLEKFLALPWEQRREMGLRGREKVEREFDRKIVMNKYLQEIEKAAHEL